MSAAPSATTRASVRQGARSFLAGVPAGHLLVALLVIGLLLRAFIAGILVPQSGFRIDTGDFTSWAIRLAANGPGAFYETGYFSDYPPGYLYVLWALGSIGSALHPLLGLDITGGLVKLPGILGDLGSAAILFPDLGKSSRQVARPLSSSARLRGAKITRCSCGSGRGWSIASAARRLGC